MYINSGVACLKFNVHICGDVVNIPKRGHLQIAQTQMRQRKMRRLISVCAISHVRHILGNGGQ